MSLPRFFVPFALFHFFAFLFSAALAAYTYYTLKSKDALQVERALQQNLSQLMVELSDEMQNQVDKMRAIASYVALTEQLSPDSFIDYANEFAREGDKWLLIEWQPIVDTKQRAQFEAHVQARFFPDFRLWEPGEDGKPVAAATRQEHVPVLFVSTQTSVNNTIGLDLAWSEERMRSKWEARDTGNAQLSGLFDIVLSPDATQPPRGFAITVPVYEQGIVPKTQVERTALIKGYIAGVYCMEDAMAQYFDKLIEQGIEISLSDTDGNSVMISAEGAIPTQRPMHGSEVSSVISLLGQKWSISLSPARQYIVENTSQYPVLFAIGIMMVWLLLSFFASWIYQISRQLFQAKESLEGALETVKTSEAHFAQLSKRDSLTGLFNRRAFFDRLDEEIGRSTRFDQPLCILLVDLDEFKKVNDTHGHLTGDHVLKYFADTCTHSFREQDMISRYGGEEFAILMLNTDIEEGGRIANRLLAEISKQQIPVVDSDAHISVTFSGGLTACLPSDNVTTVLARADRALYESKHRGRNQITIA